VSDVEIHLKAFDEASSVIQKVGENTAAALGRVETSGDALTKQTRKVDVSVRDTALSFNNMATAGMALYMAVDRVEEANVRLDKANLMVQRSNEAVEKAQAAYNLALSRFGVNSAEAKDASDKLAIAQEAQRVAVERAGLAQNNVNQTMITATLTVIPSMITMVKSAQDAFKGLEGASGLAGKAFDMLTGPVGIAMMGIAAVAGVVYMAWQNFTTASAEAEKFRKEHEEICKTLEKTDSLLKLTVTSVSDLSRKYEGLTSACSELKKELETQEEHLTQLNKNTENLNKLYGLLGTSIEQEGNMFAKNTDAVNEHIAALKSEIEVAEKLAEKTKKQLDVAEIYFNTVVKASDEYKRSVETSGHAVTEVFNDQTRSLTEKTDIVKSVISMFAARWHLTWDEASRILGHSVESILDNTKKMEEALAKVPDVFGKMEDAAKTAVNSIGGDVEEMARGMEAKLKRLNEELVGGSVWTDLMQRMVNQAQATTRVVGGLFGQMGVYATEAIPGVISFAGLSLPAAGAGPSTTINITGPLVHVAGSADRQTAALAANIVSQQLKNVVVEASSPGAPQTQKRLRFGGAGEISPAAGVATGTVAPGASSPGYGVAESWVG